MRCARAFLALLVAAACGRPQGPIPVAFKPVPCVLLSRDSLSDTLVIGMPDPIDLTHAPVPGTEAERLVFGFLYETLVRLDCEGGVVPALASRWIEEDGRRWRFTLRENARFWDGTPVTSDDVVAAWAERSRVFAESLTAPDARTVRVVLAAVDTAPLARFADPRLAISKPGVNALPALGTSSYGVSAWAGDRIDARPVGRSGAMVRFRLAAGADPRDLLDQGADFLVTDNPEVLRYAESRDVFDVLPLPWAWTYVLVGGLLIQSFDETDPWGLRAAVRGDVRAAEPPFWWTSASRCGGAGADPRYRSPAMARTIVYPETDPVARDLAQRLAAVSAQGEHRALGLSPTEFAEALAANAALAFVTAIPRRAYERCLELPAGLVLPLLDARSSLIARRGRVGVEVDWDWAPRLLAP